MSALGEGSVMSYWPVVVRRLIASGLVSACSAMPIAAWAKLIDYKFVLQAPLLHGVESLGGTLDPVIFETVLDDGAPNLSGSSTDGTYAVGGGAAGFGQVTVAGTSVRLEGGQFHVSNGPSFDVVSASTNVATTAGLIGGRTLFVATLALTDWSATALGSTGLPSESSLKSANWSGFFRLTFFPTATDKEFGTGDYVIFDAFPVSSSNFSVTVTDVSQVPAPGTLPLLALALLALLLVSPLRSTASKRLFFIPVAVQARHGSLGR